MAEYMPLPELQALAGAARGETSAETARRLGLATRTVDRYRALAAARLGARNTTHAVALAVEARLITAAPGGEDQ